MNYHELTFTYTASVEPEIINDILAAELGEIGFESFVAQDGQVAGYISDKLYNQTLLDETLAAFPLPGVSFQYAGKFIPGKDWNEEWEKNYFKPIRIGSDCIIRASFHEEEPGYTYNIVIDPKMAFGTGNHETTYLMINEILNIDLKGMEVLDMGCGTAILSILAHKRGAKQVTAIDIDEWAYKNALENIRLNHTENIRVVLGGAERIREYAPFDIIFANINRNILLKDFIHYIGSLKSGGAVFMSGFYQEDIPVIREECEKHGANITHVSEKNNWAVVKCEW